MTLRPLHTTLLCLTLLATASACGESVVSEQFDEDDVQEQDEGALGPIALSGVNADGRTVDTMVRAACSTTSVKGLSQQLVEEINCLSPGTMSKITPRQNLDMGAAVFPYLQTAAAAALDRRVAASNSPLYMNSALRTLPQQYLLYQWGQRRTCGIGLAAFPGTSNHESGLAIDMSNYNTWRSSLSRENWRWFGGGDPVHFDYNGPSKNVRSLSVLAFQKLWNRNNPNDRIAEDGGYGTQTERRLRSAPAIGFSKGAQCGNTTEPETQLAPVEVYWYRTPSGTYNLRALAPSFITRVQYKVDGFNLKSATRADGANFPAEYTFSQEGRERIFEVEGFDKSGNKVALGTGLIDVTPEYGVYIRQLGQNLYSFGLERAPGVAYIEVEVDGYRLGDSQGKSQLQVRSTINNLGTRNFTIKTFNQDGSQRGTLRRTFELK